VSVTVVIHTALPDAMCNALSKHGYQFTVEMYEEEIAWRNEQCAEIVVSVRDEADARAVRALVDRVRRGA
jgi:hypothetical protein